LRCIGWVIEKHLNDIPTKLKPPFQQILNDVKARKIVSRLDNLFMIVGEFNVVVAAFAGSFVVDTILSVQSCFPFVKPVLQCRPCSDLALAVIVVEVVAALADFFTEA
jgi:hypothetical protein